MTYFFFTFSVILLFIILSIILLKKKSINTILIIISGLVWGIAGATSLSLILSLFFTKVILNDVSSLISYVLVIPAIEEISKSILLFTPIYYAYKEKSIAFVLVAVLIGSGFSIVENIFYLIQFSHHQTLINQFFSIRLSTTLLLHNVCTIIIYFPAGIYSERRIVYFIFSLLAAYILHSVWNLISYFNLADRYNIWYLLLLFIIFITIYFIAIRKDQKRNIYNDK